MRRGGGNEQALLITTATESGEDEYQRRRRKYAFMMGLRLLCVLAAGLTYQISVLLALGLMVGGCVLPWCAVLIANDGPVKKKKPHATYRPDLRAERALPPGADDSRTVDG